jgi:hypothetical protein
VELGELWCLEMGGWSAMHGRDCDRQGVVQLWGQNFYKWEPLSPVCVARRRESRVCNESALVNVGAELHRSEADLPCGYFSAFGGTVKQFAELSGDEPVLSVMEGAAAASELENQHVRMRTRR